MPTVVRRLRVDRPAQDVFSACVDSLRTPDPRRGIVARRLDPDPPAVDGAVISTLRRRGVEREVRAVIVSFDPPNELATASEGPGALVTTNLRVEQKDEGKTTVTLTSDAGSGLPVFGFAGRLLDTLLLGRRQRSTARATLRRLRDLLSRDRPAG